MFGLKNTLDRFYRTFDFKGRLRYDPIGFPRRYSSEEDIEVSGFIASCFAYGRVDLFSPVIEKILGHAGKHPARFFKEITIKKDSRYFEGIRYRFNKEKDVQCLVYMVSQALKEHGSLKNLFYSHYRPEHEDIKIALNGFVEYFLRMDISPSYQSEKINPANPLLAKGGKGGLSDRDNLKPYGLKQFFPLPETGSTCKRMNLFLRWMVRTADIDLGIWGAISPSKLVIPLDTHVARISRCLGLTKRAASDWITAKEITASLKELDPEDPLKYDFALCHHGISGLCRGRKIKMLCKACAFYSP